MVGQFLVRQHFEVNWCVFTQSCAQGMSKILQTGRVLLTLQVVVDRWQSGSGVRV